MRHCHAILVILVHIAVMEMTVKDASAVAPPASPTPIDFDPRNIPYGRTRVIHRPLDSRQFKSLLDGRDIGTGRLRLGDQIELRAGTVYAGAFRLPKLTEGLGWIRVYSSHERQLPKRGVRVAKSDSQFMPRIVGTGIGGESTVYTAPGAHHYFFDGIEFTHDGDRTITDALVNIEQTNTIEEMSHHISFARCLIHGPDAMNNPARHGTNVGIGLDANHAAVVDCAIYDIALRGFDSQAILIFSALGPFHIENNYLVAAGENILVGGALPRVKEIIPSDITIRGNFIEKPAEWDPSDAAFNGIDWSCKNLLEFKAGLRVVVEGNILHRCFADSQVGSPIVITPSKQSGAWVQVADLAIQNNIIHNFDAYVQLRGYPHEGTEEKPTQRILIHNNLFYDGPRRQGKWALELLGKSNIVASDLTITQNTFDMRNVRPNFCVLGEDNIKPLGSCWTSVVISRNIMWAGRYGTFRGNGSTGTVGLSEFLKDYRFDHNVRVGEDASRYPPNNPIISDASDLQWADPDREDYTITGGPFASWDGGQVGVDMETLRQKTSGVRTGNSSQSSER